jgi:hypothetical protein
MLVDLKSTQEGKMTQLRSEHERSITQQQDDYQTQIEDMERKFSEAQSKYKV